MAISGYNFEDDLIRDMVRFNHTPCEVVVSGAMSPASISVECQQCRCPWPCPQVTELRAWEAAQPAQINITAAE